jgi:copper homeostasis protein (lipoprotein)
MKKLILTSLLVSVFAISCESKKEESITTPTSEEALKDEHTAKNSLDYIGTYQGTLPCADCEGIEMTITLNKDETYTSTMKYLGKDEKEFKDLGDYTWMEDGMRLSLEGIDTPPVFYFVAEGKLIQLDQEGKEITGDLAKNYELLKQ